MRSIENLVVEEDSGFNSEAWEQGRTLFVLAAIATGLWGWLEIYRDHLYPGAFWVVLSLLFLAVSWDILAAVKFTALSVFLGFLAATGGLAFYNSTALPSFTWGNDPSFWLAVHGGAVVEPFWSPLSYLVGQTACFLFRSRQFSILPQLSGLVLSLSLFLLVQEFLAHFKVKKTLASLLTLSACGALIVSRPFWNAGTMGSGLVAALGFLLILVQSRLLKAEKRHMGGLYLLMGLLWSVHPLWGMAGWINHAGVFGFNVNGWRKHWVGFMVGISPYLWVVFRAGTFFPSWGGEHPFFEALKDRNPLWDGHIQGDWSLWDALRCFGWGPAVLLAITALLSLTVSFSDRRRSVGTVVDFWGWVVAGIGSVLLYSKRTDALGPVVPWFLFCLVRYLLLSVEYSAQEASVFLRSRRGTASVAVAGMLLAISLAWLPGQRYLRSHFYFPEEHALNLSGSLEGKSFLICDDPFEYYACLEARLMEPPSKSSAVILKGDLDQRWYVGEFIEKTPELLFSNITGPLDTIVKSLVLNNRERWEVHWSRQALPDGWNEPRAFPSVLTQVFQPQSEVVADPSRFQLRYDLTALPKEAGLEDTRTRAYLSRYSEGFSSMGNKLMERGRYSDAIHAYDRALRIDPSFAEPKRMLDRIYAQRNILEAAELEFERVIKSYPGEMARVTKGLAQAQKDRDEPASMRCLDQMIRINAAMADAQYQLSRIYAQRGRVTEADALLRASVEHNPEQADAQMALGRYLAKTGNRLEAERAFRAVLSIEPQNKPAQIELWKLLNKP